jgi:membrane-associated phospholipid phosphatase
VLAALICLSTLLIKQHTVLDVAGGLLLGGMIARPVYRHTLESRISRKLA